MKIFSPAFAENQMIPDRHARDGLDRSPPLRIEDVPREAKTLAIIVDDPDAPGGTFTHWLLFNIGPFAKEISENDETHMGTLGRNDYGDIGYGGPKPPSGEHRYVFKLYALDRVLTLSRGAKRAEVESAMTGHILAQSQTIGRYAAK